MKCRSVEMSVISNVGQLKCQSFKCRSIEMSHYQNSSFSTGGPKMLSVTFKRHFCPKLGIFFSHSKRKKNWWTPSDPPLDQIVKRLSWHPSIGLVSSRGHINIKSNSVLFGRIEGSPSWKKRLMLSLNRVERFYEQMKNSFKALISLFK